MKLTITVNENDPAYMFNTSRLVADMTSAVEESMRTPSGPGGNCGAVRDNNDNIIVSWVLDTRPENTPNT